MTLPSIKHSHNSSSRSVLPPLPKINKHLASMVIMAPVFLALKAIIHNQSNNVKLPMRDSKLSGEEYTREVLNCLNPRRIREVCRMDKRTFLSLCKVLKDRYGVSGSSHVSVEQKLLQFIYITGTADPVRHVAERFQCSIATVSTYFAELVEILADFGTTLINLPNSRECPPKISTDPRFYPFFECCIGALDGTHVPVHIVGDSTRYRDRGGSLSQNVLAACTFDGLFCYVLAGFEGSAHDQRVVDAAFERGFKVPAGRYYLGDAGYGICSRIITPYRGVRYHLREWNQCNLAPCNPKELFNHRHSQLRNCIERNFGVVKRRFKILKTAPEYPFVKQVDIVKALFGLHNFIKLEQGEDAFYDDDGMEATDRCGSVTATCNDNNIAYLEGPVTRGEKADGSNLRDRIAARLWQDYVQYRNA